MQWDKFRHEMLPKPWEELICFQKISTTQFYQTLVISHHSHRPAYDIPWKEFRAKIRMKHFGLWGNWQIGPQILKYFQEKILRTQFLAFFPSLPLWNSLQGFLEDYLLVYNLQVDLNKNICFFVRLTINFLVNNIMKKNLFREICHKICSPLEDL